MILCPSVPSFLAVPDTPCLPSRFPLSCLSSTPPGTFLGKESVCLKRPPSEAVLFFLACCRLATLTACPPLGLGDVTHLPSLHLPVLPMLCPNTCVLLLPLVFPAHSTHSLLIVLLAFIAVYRPMILCSVFLSQECLEPSLHLPTRWGHLGVQWET